MNGGGEPDVADAPETGSNERTDRHNDADELPDASRLASDPMPQPTPTPTIAGPTTARQSTRFNWMPLLAAGVVGGLVSVGVHALLQLPVAATTPIGTSAPDAALPPGPGGPSLMDPEPARRAVTEALTELGVPALGIDHGLLPLRGKAWGAHETLPLVSFTCPMGEPCDAALDRLAESIGAAGFAVHHHTRGDREGRPYFRAVSRDGRPALALRAFPSGPRLTLVIDDVGVEPALLDALLALDDDVTYAVTPTAPHSAAVADKLLARGREIIAHLPMEPAPPRRPDGPDFLTTQQSAEQTAKQTQALLDRLPAVAGVNNRLGGRFTASRAHVWAVLGVLHQRALFFLDERTTPASVVETAARAAGVRAAVRTHFLDTTGDALQATLRAVEAALVLDGHAVVVARPDPATLAALRGWLDRLAERKIHLLRASEIAL